MDWRAVEGFIEEWLPSESRGADPQARLCEKSALCFYLVQYDSRFSYFAIMVTCSTRGCITAVSLHVCVSQLSFRMSLHVLT